MTDVSHDGWLHQLKAWTAMYKNGDSSVDRELVMATYLANRIQDCSDGGTTVNSASQGQAELSAASVLGGETYHVSYTAMLGSAASVTVAVGGETLEASWSTQPPDGGPGVYHGTVPVDSGAAGDVAVSLHRGGRTIATAAGRPIGGCTDGFANFNPVAPFAFVE